MRKPVQIAIANNGNFLHMCVLCDDGSMWAGSSGKGLTRLSDIPQDEPEQPATSPDVVKAMRNALPQLLNVIASAQEVVKAHERYQPCGDRLVSVMALRTALKALEATI